MEDNQIMDRQDIKGHNGSAWQLSWSHPADGNILASCGYDGRIVLWRQGHEGWTQIQEFVDPEGSVNTIQWAPREYGLILAAGNAQGTVTLYSQQDNGEWK